MIIASSRTTVPADAPWMHGLHVPASWTRTKVKYLMQAMRAGETIPLTAINSSGEFPVYGANGVRGYTSKKTHEGTYVLIGRQGARCGNVHLVSGPFWASEHAIVGAPAEAVHPSWLAYLLYVMNLGQYSANAAQPGIGVGQIGPLTVYVPTFEEQSAIADFLDRETSQIDTLISEQNALITVLLERRRAVLFGSIDGLEGERIRLRHLFRPSAEANRPDEEVLSVYRDYGVIPKSSRSDNFNKTPENLDRYLFVRPGDLVVNRMKAWQGSLGISNHRGIVSADYEVLRPVNDRLEPEFAHYLLRSPRLIGEYRIRSTGIRPSQWRLYWDQMGDIAVVVPPTNAQQDAVHRIEAQFASIDTLIARAEQHIELARERRAALITEAVTGQIEVTGKGAA